MCGGEERKASLYICCGLKYLVAVEKKRSDNHTFLIRNYHAAYKLSGNSKKSC